MIEVSLVTPTLRGVGVSGEKAETLGQKDFKDTLGRPYLK